jgi:hypothetical protein
MEKLNLDRMNLKKFGITMGFALLIITIIIFIRHRHSPLYTLAVSIIFFTLAFIGTVILKPVYIFWMKLASALGWINNRLILTILFYLIFAPIGICLRLFKTDLLERKIDKKRESYWLKKTGEAFKPADYERQF